MKFFKQYFQLALPFYLIIDRLNSKKYIKRTYRTISDEPMEYKIRRDILKEMLPDLTFGLSSNEEIVNLLVRKNYSHVGC